MHVNTEMHTQPPAIMNPGLDWGGIGEKGHSGSGEMHKQGHEGRDKARCIFLVESVSVCRKNERTYQWGLAALVARPLQMLFLISTKGGLIRV